MSLAVIRVEKGNRSVFLRHSARACAPQADRRACYDRHFPVQAIHLNPMANGAHSCIVGTSSMFGDLLSFEEAFGGSAASAKRFAKASADACRDLALLLLHARRFQRLEIADDD